MATIETKLYVCDICGKEFTDKDMITPTTVPSQSADSEGRPSYLSQTKVDLCESCNCKLHEVVFHNFAYILDTYGGKQIKKKF